MKSVTKAIAYVTLFAVSLLSAVSCARAPDKPHVVVILVDDMGYGDPGCYNPESKIPTPNIDRLAREGMRFTDAHASGALCHPSRYGLLTGTYPFRADLSVWRTRPTIREGQETLASLLKRAGYNTAMVGKWHLGFREKGYENPLSGGPVDRGFSSYFGFRASTDIPPYFYIRGDRAVSPPTDSIEANSSPGWSPIQGAFWREGGISPDLELKDVLPRFTEEALSVIGQYEKGAGDPLFLYLAYAAPHTPWLPSADFTGQSGAGMYGDFMMMVDAEIGKVLEALDRHGMSRNTLLVFTSDNGPVWYDRDVKRFGHDAAGGFRGMKGDAWEAGHRMPFIVRWPGVVEAASVSDQLIAFPDIMTTVAAAVGLELPGEAGPDSYSFLPVLKGAQPPGEYVRPLWMMESANGTMVARKGKWKYIDGLGSGGFSRPGKVEPNPGDPLGQLYDLSADPGELENLWSRRPELVHMFRMEIQKAISPAEEGAPE